MRARLMHEVGENQGLPDAAGRYLRGPGHDVTESARAHIYTLSSIARARAHIGSERFLTVYGAQPPLKKIVTLQVSRYRAFEKMFLDVTVFLQLPASVVSKKVS